MECQAGCSRAKDIDRSSSTRVRCNSLFFIFFLIFFFLNFFSLKIRKDKRIEGKRCRLSSSWKPSRTQLERLKLASHPLTSFSLFLKILTFFFFLLQKKKDTGRELQFLHAGDFAISGRKRGSPLKIKDSWLSPFFFLSSYFTFTWTKSDDLRQPQIH